jgi:cbb3-type cytochrome oxidase maturation protein
MSVILILIIASLAVALTFLVAFIWAVRGGQYEDTCTPAMRVLTEETTGGKRGEESGKANSENFKEHEQQTK